MSQRNNDNEVRELIQLIDRNKDNLFKRYDVFRDTWALVLIVDIIVMLFWLCVLVVFSNEAVGTRVALSLSFMSVAVALFSFIKDKANQAIIQVNYQRLKMCCIEERHKPLLQALIKMKCDNPQYELRQIYDMDPEIFTQKNLLRFLYNM